MKDFKFINRGIIASLGKGEAIGVVGTKKLKGFIAAMLKKVVEIRYLYKIGGIPLVIKKGRL
ncbi:NADH dehydrogenase-like protein [compost metagenome]